MKAIPLPPAAQVARMAHGYGRAGLIRRLYGERCSPAEIAEWVGTTVAHVRRTVRSPVQPSTWSRRRE